MRIPNWTDPQLVDANGTGGLNAAMSALSGSFAILTSGAFAVPGILYPETSGYSISGNIINIGLGSPWALITSGGVVAQARGTQTGQTTTSYSVDFTPFVPPTGSTLAYLACSGITILEDPFPIPGPPPGHPSYNPNFVPTIGYATVLDSVAVYATSGVPDGVNAFILAEVTLVSGSPASPTIAGRQRGSLYKSQPTATVAAGNLTVQNGQQMLLPAANGQTSTLPLAGFSQGLTFNFINNLSSWTISTQGGDTVVGLPGGPVSSVALPASGACSLYSEGNGIWNMVACSPNVVPVPTVPPQPQIQTVSGITGFPDGSTITFPMPFTGSVLPTVDITDAGGFNATDVTAYSYRSATLSGFVLRAFVWISGTGPWTPANPAFSYIAIVPVA